MSEIGTPVKSTPVKTSSVALVNAAVEAKNASQKADLEFLRPDLAKKSMARLKAVEEQLEGLRERIERLENEDNIPGTPYMG